jgi:hypothetical protein
MLLAQIKGSRARLIPTVDQSLQLTPTKEGKHDEKEDVL